MCLSIRLLAEEKRIAESYAKMRSMSLEEAFMICTQNSGHIDYR